MNVQSVWSKRAKLETNLISCCLRLLLLPAHCFKPQTMTSSRKWEAELKCSATGNPRDRFWIMRRGLLKRSRKRLPVSRNVVAFQSLRGTDNCSDDRKRNTQHSQTDRWSGNGCYEHLRSIRNRSRGFPVAEHFNSASHSLDDIMVCGLKQCAGSNISRKQHEMRLIFNLGTLRPNGLNINFNFLWLCLARVTPTRGKTVVF